MGKDNGPDNPYAAPVNDVSVAIARLSVPAYLTWPLSRIFAAAVFVVLISGVCVLSYQVFAHSTVPAPRAEWNVWQAMSFASAGIAITVVFGIPGVTWSYEQYAARAALVSVVVFVGVILGAEFIRRFPHNDSTTVFGTFLASHIAVPAAICWIRRVPVRWRRLLLGGALAFATWFGLSIAVVAAVVRHQRTPYDDYTGFTVLTMLWALTVSLTTVAVLILPGRNSAADAQLTDASDETTETDEDLRH